MDLLETVLIYAGLALAAVATAYVVIDRVTDRLLVAAFAVLEVALLVQVVVGCVALAQTSRDVNGIVFVGYLVGTCLFVPAGVWWALGEKSRAGTAALVVVGLVVAVLELRLGQIWAGGA